jgi:hypothetical protein
LQIEEIYFLVTGMGTRIEQHIVDEAIRKEINALSYFFFIKYIAYNMSDYGLDDRVSIPDRGREFFF